MREWNSLLSNRSRSTLNSELLDLRLHCVQHCYLNTNTNTIRFIDDFTNFGNLDVARVEIFRNSH